MSTSRALRAAALSAAGLLALTACNGGDDDHLGDKDSGNSTTGGGIGGTATIPDAATKNSDAGAEAFAKWYCESVINPAYSTGNISAMVKYSDPKCIVCRATVGDIATAWARGKVQGGQVSVSGLDATKASDTLTNVELKYSKTRYVEVDGSGTNVFSAPAQTGLDIVVQLTYSAKEKTWLVREIVNQAARGGKGASPSPTP
jgi:hypothetical protein